MVTPVSELFGLEDQVAVVTGASGVLGGAIAQGLAAAGARVGLLARRRDRLEELAESLGESAIALEADVLDATQLERARATVLDRWAGSTLSSTPRAETSPGQRSASGHSSSFRRPRSTRSSGSTSTVRCCRARSSGPS
jgi:NADPH:quinone reductase-like Zn-dependent oxidoreductase